MNPTEEERARRVLAALRGVPPAQLRTAATHSPEPVRGILNAVADALQRPDPVAALAAVLGGAAADATETRALLDTLARLVGLDLGTLARESASLERAAEEAEAAQRNLAETLREAPPAVEDAELGALLERALAVAGDDTPVRAVRAALAETRSLAQVANDVLQSARRDPERAARAVDRLKASAAGLEAALAQARDATSGLARVLPLLADLRGLAEQRGKPDAVAQLTLVEAGLAERLQGLADAGVQGRWEAAFDAALAAGALPFARAAGQRLQVVAVDRGDLARVAVIAHRVADLARDTGEPRAEVLARLEAAMALVRLPAHREDARAMVADACALAEREGEPALRARARLTEGQLLEQVDEVDGAVRSYQAVLAMAKNDTSFPREAGRAALHLGRIEAARGKRAQGAELLELARAIGDALDEWLLYAPATVALVEHLVNHDVRERVGEILREFAADAPRMGGEIGRRADEALRGEVAARWGREVVVAMLRG